MPLKLLKGVNVTIDGEGNLSLLDPQYHGCAVFDVACSQHFELQLTPEQDDSWFDRAGAYCVGIMDSRHVSRIPSTLGESSDESENEYYEGAEVESAWAMTARISSLFTLSTGSFRFSNGIFWEHSEQIFDGSLKQRQSLIMQYRRGKLGYRLDTHLSLFDVTSKMHEISKKRIQMNQDGWYKGKGKGWYKGKDKGKGKGNGTFNEEYEKKIQHIPCVWVFAQEGDDPSYQRNTAKLSLTQLLRCPHVEEDLCPFAKRIKTLWDDQALLDCTIECGGEQFGAHRVVLCAASPVFKAAFTGSLCEAKQARFEVKNCDQPAVVKAMLEFMYRGCLPDVNLHTLIELLPLAVQYQIDQLCLITGGMLIDKVTVESVREILQVVKQFQSHHSVAWAHAELLGRLQADIQLLNAAV